MAVEFRGCKNLVFAPIEQDNAEGFVTGNVIPLAPVAEISKTVETASEAHYYDNKPAIVISSEGADTVTFTIAVPTDEVLAQIEGRVYDSTKKTFIEAPRTNNYFAVGYILGETGEGDDERYVWRFKGTFNIPDVTSATENDGTDANNMSLEFTGIYTDYEFENGGGTGVKAPAKAMFIRESSNVATAEQFFAQVSTPDTTFEPSPTPVTTYALTITQAENTTVTVTRGGTALENGASLSAGDELVISVTGGTVTVNGEAFTSGNTYTVAGNVAVVSTEAEG